MDTDALAYLAVTPSARMLLGAYHVVPPTGPLPWTPRLFSVEGVEPTELSAIHGRLIAFGFLDVDVSDVNVGVKYQVTTSGRQVLVTASATSTTNDTSSTETVVSDSADESEPASANVSESVAV
jgi:hypothetical protein